jgi:hypothetical protein
MRVLDRITRDGLESVFEEWVTRFVNWHQRTNRLKSWTWTIAFETCWFQISLSILSTTEIAEINQTM